MAFIDGQGFVEKENFERALAYAESEVVRNYIRTTRTAVDHLPEYIQRDGRDVEKFTVSLPHDKDGGLLGIDYTLDALSDCRDDMDIVYGGAINIEVTNKTATKGNVLRFLGKMLGISKKTMACGDGGNDREMLEGRRYRRRHGKCGGKRKKAASFITKSMKKTASLGAIENLFYSGDSPQRSYSLLKASMGFRRLAFLVGAQPKITPTPTEKPKPRSTAKGIRYISCPDGLGPAGLKFSMMMPMVSSDR